MATPDPGFADALDNLTVQVSTDNVLAAHRVFRDHARDLDDYLLSLTQTATIGLCGGDPVSRDAASDRSFGGKIEQLIEVHRAHQRELVAVAEHLRDVALRYGFTESEIDESLRVDR